MRHVMIDLETLATTADAAIISIGAVKFDAKKIAEKGFYTPISIETNLAVGRRISEDTLAWWMKQSDEARKVFNEPNEPLDNALEQLVDWIGHDNPIVWSNGASFDIPILEHAFTQFSMTVPWKFWNSRCYRTIKSLLKTKDIKIENPMKHNALADAYAQARHLQLIWEQHGDLA